MPFPSLRLDPSALNLTALRAKVNRSPAPGPVSGPFVPAPPRADLLPPQVRQRANDRRSKARAITATSAIAVAGALVWGSGALSASDLASQLADAEDEAQALNLELAIYSPVTNLVTQTQALTDTVDDQTAGKVSHAAALAHFLAAAEGTFSPTSVALDTSENSACTTTDPFSSVETAGCITFSGTDLSGTGASELVRALTSDPWFTDAFVPTVGSATGESGAMLNGSVSLTVAAYELAEETPAPLPEEVAPDAAPTQD